MALYGLAICVHRPVAARAIWSYSDRGSIDMVSVLSWRVIGAVVLSIWSWKAGVKNELIEHSILEQCVCHLRSLSDIRMHLIGLKDWIDKKFSSVIKSTSSFRGRGRMCTFCWMLAHRLDHTSRYNSFNFWLQDWNMLKSLVSCAKGYCSFGHAPRSK